MSELIENAKGHCLCGAVQVEAKQMDAHFGVCHCSMCRLWTGGPFLGTDCGDEVSFSNSNNVGTYDSSEWAERGFCKTCGSHLFYRLKASGQYIMPIGLFEHCENFKFDHQIFIDQKPSYYDFANETTMLTSEQVFADFAEDDHEH